MRDIEEMNSQEKQILSAIHVLVNKYEKEKYDDKAVIFCLELRSLARILTGVEDIRSFCRFHNFDLPR